MARRCADVDSDGDPLQPALFECSAWPPSSLSWSTAVLRRRAQQANAFGIPIARRPFIGYGAQAPVPPTLSMWMRVMNPGGASGGGNVTSGLPNTLFNRASNAGAPPSSITAVPVNFR